MTLQEKIAALPPYSKARRYVVPTLPGRILRDCVEVVKASDYDALLARNALLCEALRDQAGICDDAKCKRCALVRAVLAACEVKP